LYKVSFNANGGTGTVADSQMVKAGETVTLPGGDGFSRDGYVFGNWNTAADGTGTNYNPGASYTIIAGGSTLYAKWIPLYTVSFDVNSGTGTVPASQTVKTGENIMLPGGDGLSKEWYLFSNWNTAADGTGTDYAAGDSYTVTADTVLYAKWGTVPGATLAAKFDWLYTNAKSDTKYLVEVDATTTSLAPPSLSYSGKSNITIKLEGIGGEKTVSLNSSVRFSLFTIESGVTLILDNNIILKGHSNNNRPLILINSDGVLEMNEGAKITDNDNSSSEGYLGGGVYIDNGTFTMNGGEISGNTGYNGGGVYVKSGIFNMNAGKIYGNTSISGGGVYVNSGTFNMEGGEIYSNTSSSYGGGVYIDNGTFTMNAGKIYGNTSTYGGVHVDNDGTFNMNGGEIYSNTRGVWVTGIFAMISGKIYSNTASSQGGGVCVSSFGTFNMEGGEIYSNTSSSYGGGVCVGSSGGTFNMEGGEISGNTASRGGGVYVGGTFTKSGGGTIYGTDGGDLANNADSATTGNAVYESHGRRRETTAGPEIDLDSTKSGSEGGWEN
jgi:hypothetical protein